MRPSYLSRFASIPLCLLSPQKAEGAAAKALGYCPVFGIIEADGRVRVATIPYVKLAS